MAHHPVIGSNAPRGDVPATLQRLEGLHMVEAVLGQGEHQLLHLHHRGQIGHEDASGLQDPAAGLA